jgi:hypothetical protein
MTDIENNFDLDSFDEPTKKIIIRRANSKMRGKLSPEMMTKTVDLVNEELNQEFSKTAIGNFLTSVGMWLEDRSDIWNTQEGVVSQFVLDGRGIGDIVQTQRAEKQIIQVTEAINNARRISLTSLALENKDSILEELKETINKKKGRGKITTPLIDDEGKRALQKLVDILEKIDDSEIQEAKKITFDSLTKLERSLVNISVMPAKARKEYYTFWQGIGKKFGEFGGVVEAAESLIGSLVQEMKDAGISAGLPEDFRRDKEEGKEDNTGFKNENVKGLLEKTYLPSYIIKFTPIEITDDGEDAMALSLVKEFLTMVGKELSTNQKDIRSEATNLITSTIREDVDAEGGGMSGSFDPTAADDLIDEIEEQEEKIKRVKRKKGVDPLFSILVKNNDIEGEFEAEVLEKAREGIKSELTMENLGIFQEEMTEIIDNQISKFLDRYEKASSVGSLSFGGKYSLPMMDNNDIKNFFKLSNAEFTVEYYENAILKTKTFNKYEQAVSFINKGTRKFFRKLSNYIELEPSMRPLMNRPVQPRGLGRQGTKTFPQQLGRVTKPLVPKMAKANIEKMKELQEIIDLIEEYYIKPLTGNMILLEDVPEFYSSKEFKDFPMLLSSSNVNQARKSIAAGNKPIVEKGDYKAMNSFLYALQRPDELFYTDALNDRFQKGLEAYINFWAHADSLMNNKQTLPEIINSAEIEFGKGLHEIASATLSEKQIAKIDFNGEPLSFWAEQPEGGNPPLESLLTLIESDEWQTFVNNSLQGSGIKTENRKLIYKLKESDMKLAGPITNAMLEASDILRKMKGQKVYNSNLDVSEMDDIEYVINLISKEDNLDIYGIDIYNILKSNSSFNDIANQNKISTEIVYKIKGLFR